ncbi:MAG: pyridoxamine 5'-phosphate oxidase family protein [Myxococcaceae bacterium]
MSSDRFEQAVDKLNALIRGIRVAMLTTVDEDGALRCRPMAALERGSENGVLWFVTSEASHKILQVENERHVNVAYASPEDNRYVSVSGAGRLVRDRKKATELWTPVLKAWFPDGVDSPDLALLRVEVTLAEYWDSSSSRMAQLTGFAEGEEPAWTRYEEHPLH